MKKSGLTFLAAIVIASFGSVAAMADCPAQVGPVQQQYITNCNFDGSSPWTFSGNASLDTPSWGPYAGRLDAEAFGSARIDQLVDLTSVPTNYVFSMSVYVNYTLNTYQGNEVLKIQIRRASDDAVLETFATVSPGTSGYVSGYLSGQYGGQQIKVVFLVAGGRFYGDTTFWVDEVQMWGGA